MKIYQVCDELHYGDGVSNDIIKKTQLIRELGYECDIYANVIKPDLPFKAYNIELLKDKVQKDDIIIHHYSGYSKIIDILKAINCKKVMIYHNITPPQFVEHDIKEHCLLGLKQIQEISHLYDYFAGDSEFNVDCLYELGITDKADVLPIVVEFDKINVILRNNDDAKYFIFVGRIVENKCIEDVIAVFDCYYNNFNSNSNLLLVGNDQISNQYTSRLHKLVSSLNSGNNIKFMGKVSDVQLKQLYNTADCFVCMSEHEGFGIPLLEAMNYQLPVIAYDAAAVSSTLGNSGVLIKKKNAAKTAAIIDTILNNENIKNEIIAAQNKNLERFSSKTVSNTLKLLINKWATGENFSQQQPNNNLTVKENNKNDSLKIQIQGPFETTYSLALVNRKLAEALDDLGENDISIYSTEGTGYYVPSESNMRTCPHARQLWLKGEETHNPHIALRNMYPPAVTGLTAQYNFQNFFWEEDRVPKHIIAGFNSALDGVGASSNFVAQALIDSGLEIPVKTVKTGVDLPKNYNDIPPYKFNTQKKIKFLHISSAFPRKGVDILLNAYFKAFTQNDDVCLIIKSFPNPHNEVEKMLKQLYREYPNGPEVEFINRDLSQDDLFGMYKSADCYVHSARGEGFGLPVAEAMLARLPVIVSNNTAMADFCNDNNCITIDYEMEMAHSHLSENSRWAKPNEETLRKRLYDFVYNRASLNIDEKVEAAYNLISTEYTWASVAKRWLEFINEVKNKDIKPKVDMVTTWNTKCGIAEFTRYFIEATNIKVDYTVFPNKNSTKLINKDENYVAPRIWQFGGEDTNNITSLIQALKKSTSQIVHIQYNFGFFALESLAQIAFQLYGVKKVIISFHNTADLVGSITSKNKRFCIDNLNKSYCIIVHQPEDIINLTHQGIKKEIIKLIPLGQVAFKNLPLANAKEKLGINNYPVIGSYGFLFPHKAIHKVIEAVAILKKKHPNILYIASCSLYDSDSSIKYYTLCKEYIERLGLQENVALISEFLEPKQSMQLLQACDCCVMTYDPSTESASGAVRFCVAAKRPLITTKQKIFKEFENCSLQIKKNTPKEIAAAIEKCLDARTSEKYISLLNDKVNQTSWQVVGRQYIELYRNAIL